MAMITPGAARRWREEIERLRIIALDSGLTEERKWGKPCFTLEGKNVAIIIPFKESCAFSFFKGALLKDAKGMLGRPGENTQAARWVKVTSVEEVERFTPTLKAYLREAIALERSGAKLEMKKGADYATPEELERKFAQSPQLKRAFYALTPGRQRGYLFHFSGAKQPKTREARIEKYVPQILAGKGLNDDARMTR